MQEREKKIRSWFDMWLMQRDTGIEKLFAPDAIYTGKLGAAVQRLRCHPSLVCRVNTRGKVLAWEIKQFFHRDNQTVVEWYFKNEMSDGRVEKFDGLSLVVWTEDGRFNRSRNLAATSTTTTRIKTVTRPSFGRSQSAGFKNDR